MINEVVKAGFRLFGCPSRSTRCPAEALQGRHMHTPYMMGDYYYR